MKGCEMEMHSEIEACRTCGIFFLTSSNLLRYLFGNEPEIVHVRQELQSNTSWKMQLSENDAFPKYICTICLLEFHRIFKFQTAVVQTQLQLQQLYNLQQENIQKIKIKTEIGEEANKLREPAAAKSLPDEPNVCAFIYVDDLSDGEEYENHESRNITPFKVPHIPIKDEIIEEAYVPKTEESLAPEMSVLALTQTTNNNAANATKQPREEIADVATAGIQCQHCLHISEDQQQHRQHLLRVHETKPVECHMCGKQFPPGTTDTRLKYHMKWHRINKHVKCSQCGFHCPSREVLNEHMRAVHTRTPCKVCGKLLLPKKMRLHLQKHQKSESSQNLDCPYCASFFTTEEERSQHISLFHNTLNEQLTMSSFELNTAADAENTFLSDLQIDETPSSSRETTSTTIASTSSNDIDFNAPYEEELDECAENFTASNDFAEENSDMSVIAESEEDLEIYEPTEETDKSTKFACAQCPESFARIDQLIAHAQTHCVEKPKPFECQICGKVFELKFSLNRHMKKHKNTTL